MSHKPSTQSFLLSDKIKMSKAGGWPDPGARRDFRLGLSMALDDTEANYLNSELSQPLSHHPDLRVQENMRASHLVNHSFRTFMLLKT